MATSRGERPLLIASNEGRLHIVTNLIEGGADINQAVRVTQLHSIPGKSEWTLRCSKDPACIWS